MRKRRSGLLKIIQNRNIMRWWSSPDCREGVHIQHALQEQYDALQNAFESRMAQVSLQDIMDRFEERRTQTRGH